VVDAVGSDADLADSWRTLYCIATNFSRARETILTRGNVARCVRASVSIPVALPPVVFDGDLLIDGGTFNNFPTDVMARMGVRRIIGVDLGRDRKRKFDFDEVPGPWAQFRDRLRGRRRRYRLPTLGSVLMETTILYSSSRRQQAKEFADVYLHPDLGRIGLLDWKAFEQIVDIGYQHGREVLSKLSDEELAPYRDA
jgi:NTE family protein